MDERLLALRAKMKEQKAATTTVSTGGGDKRFYRFYDIPVDGSCALRFVPDGDEKNSFFWVEKQMFSWEYADPERPGQTVRINMPCRNMYEPRTCPVTQMISAQYKTNENAKKMWVTKNYIYQGFVRNSDLTEEEVPENPIRLYEFSKNLHTIQYNALIAEDEETALPAYPIGYDVGLNFIIKKAKKGEHNNYDGSKYGNKVNSLTEEEVVAIEQHGLYKLREFLPKQPSEEHFALQVEMAEALLNGEPWNPEWETLWKPFRPTNKNTDGGEEAPTTKAKTVTKTATKAVESDDDGAASVQSSPATMSIMERLAKAKAAAKNED